MSDPYEVEFRPEAISDLDRLTSDVREANRRLRLLTIHLVGHRREIYR